MKTNPGHHLTADGEIHDVTYENIKINQPLTWNIYIGPQQQAEPNGVGPGCMTYPLKPECITEPRISLNNITLRNISTEGGLLPPGIVRCNSTNACHGIVFDNVVSHNGWWQAMNWTYITEYAHGTVINNSYPVPALGASTERVFNPYTVENVLTFMSQLV